LTGASAGKHPVLVVVRHKFSFPVVSISFSKTLAIHCRVTRGFAKTTEQTGPYSIRLLEIVSRNRSRYTDCLFRITISSPFEDLRQ